MLSLRRVPWRTLAREFAADPVEFAVNLPDLAFEHGEVSARRAHGDGIMPWPPCPYAADDDWEERLHRAIGATWPCPAVEEFRSLWPEVMRTFEARGVEPGRGAFAGWGDGEPGLARAAWCLVRHLEPAAVVETGVARGVTSRVVLEALERNARGHLWSIDLPPPGERAIHEQIGMAVTQRLRPRWTYVRGSSRRRLRRVLAREGPIDLFIHDSKHTSRNLLFELDCAWRRLRPGGAVIADDVDLNCGFHAFRGAHAGAATLVCHAEPLRPDPPRQDGCGVFGIAVKPIRDRA